MPNKNGRKIKISHNKILCTNEFLPLRCILLLERQQLEYYYSAIRHGNNKRVKLRNLTTWKNLNLLRGAINHAFIQAIKFNLQRGFKGAHLRNARFANHD